MSDYKYFLSKPHIDVADLESVRKTMEDGWIAPVGPELNEFENKLEEHFPNKRVLATNSGTSALHLALCLSGVGEGDDVLVGSFTFAAAANVVRYQNANPIFIDSEPKSWNTDPNILDQYLKQCSKIPKALIVTHLYGMPADLNSILKVCNHYGVSVIEDAAEALGSKYHDQYLGGFGDFGIVSFNGNKIITTSGGGALISDSDNYVKAKHLATQANRGTHGYDHDQVGFNYRLSNVLAGLGLSQLSKLDDFVNRKQEIFRIYKSTLFNKFFSFQDDLANCSSNRWLTTPLLDESILNQITTIDLVKHLDEVGIESRLLWKPLHLHKAYRSHPYVGTQVAETIFNRGFCLPSGVGLTNDELKLIANEVNEFVSKKVS